MSLDWKLEGLCTRIGRPDDWFAQGDGRAGQQREKQTALVCKGCPVIEKCLDVALENREQYGIWGGMTVVQRNRIIRTRAKDTAA